ncbi:3-hydroxyisobutyrate dehydrogenase [Colwellia chukchiensis]|uniref:3-hydroxyisobutyrate dehydrogenase n=1 Tax=Colwellia chukchiensis TaxID=641665 RepID=A0A1H7SHD5_9GAMM|nr:NAD(P)-dependent oxidoreductase [Colwellia chukchiensis]SEL72070.1 3-hydroxyisobutyrate dehydrogenase [Colwellia chukchiensis]
MKKISFIGLGVMGFPMAGHLQKSGYQVTVYNRTTTKAEAWVQQYGGAMASTPAAAAKDSEIVFICVGNDDDLRQVTLGLDGVFSTIKANTIVVDHTTASATVARELAEKARTLNVGFLDAPVSGGEAGAVNGQLTIMIGGEQSSYAAVEPVMQCYAKFSKLLGAVGSGQLAKMMNQICIAGVIQGLAEALHFGKNAGLDCESVVEVISQGAAGSWQMDNRHKTMLNNEYNLGFAVDWMRKDLDIALTEAKQNGSTLPLTALVDQFYADVQKNGGNRWDTSSLLTRL